MADKYYIERRDDGTYAVTKQGAERASTITKTQAEAIDYVKQVSPASHPDVERVRDTEAGGRDKWRKA